jgi:NTE family protein
MRRFEFETGDAPDAVRHPAQAGGRDRSDEERILVLQGGGALGAYQAGAFEALSAQGYEPQWLAGISIGAINAALIAGNPPERRLERLREFWRTVTSGPAPFVWDADGPFRAYVNAGAAAMAALVGAPGLYAPRLPPSIFPSGRGPRALGWYDTEPLRRTLDALVDFDELNSGRTRLSVGAVNVRTGNFAYFDTATERLDARHIMASGALPPGFPPVEIDGEYYWDGGLVSNTPLQYVLDQRQGQRPRLVFQVDLFPARGELPTDLSDMHAREKDIRYSSRTRLNTDQELEWQAFTQAAGRLLSRLPPELADDPDARRLADLASYAQRLDVVHLIYRTRRHESHAKDYEFSRLSMLEHWAAGRSDVLATLSDPRWVGREPCAEGVRVFDLAPGPRDLAA